MFGGGDWFLYRRLRALCPLFLGFRQFLADRRMHRVRRQRYYRAALVVQETRRREGRLLSMRFDYWLEPHR